MKILNAEQIRALDAYTIEHEPIPSIELMERASKTFTRWFIQTLGEQNQPVHIFCGPGNNGGDGLAIARLLHGRGYQCAVYLCQISKQPSEDNTINRERLPQDEKISVQTLEEGTPFPDLPAGAMLIDAIFGSGLNRPVTGYWAELFRHINKQDVVIVAVDIPSGLFADRHTDGVTIEADHTLTFELPKRAFLFPENQDKVGQWIVQSIGLSEDYLQKLETPYYYVDEDMACRYFHRRSKFSHKGTYGHALLIAGSYGKVGAAILSARAALRSGVGLLTVHAPRCAYEILQISVPEAMVSIDRHRHFISEWPVLDPYQAIGIGPGIDTRDTAVAAVLDLVSQARQPLVIDADALNILSRHPEYLKQLPANSILTPHPKEFERLFGESPDHFARNDLQRQKAQELGIIIVLKGAHTCIALPNGNCYFNSTGNPGMATAGSGDVLTGIITGLLAQGYDADEAAVFGVFLHGLAGDLAVEDLEHHSLIAGDLVTYLGHAFMQMKISQ